MITYESNTPRVIGKICDDFNTLLTSFYKKGYFLVETIVCPLAEDNTYNSSEREYNFIPDPTMRYIMRTIARQVKRPFVRVHYNEWREYKRNSKGMLVSVPGKPNHYIVEPEIKSSFHVVVPKRVYLSPIINPLILVSKSKQHRWSRIGEDVPVTTWCNTRDHYFEFKNPQIWRDFEAQFSERDEFRKALKLPTPTK